MIAKNKKLTCCWSQDTDDDSESGAWNTECGNAFSICDGTPSDNSMTFCCYCGFPIDQKPFTYKDEGEE